MVYNTRKRKLRESISARDVWDFDILQYLKSNVFESFYNQFPGAYVTQLNYGNDRFTEEEYLTAAKFYSDLFDIYEAKYGYFGDKDYLILEKGTTIESYVRDYNIDFPSDQYDGFELTVDMFKKIL